MMFRLLILTLIFFTEMSAYADASFPAHSGDSPWSFTVVTEPSDTFVVNDTDSTTIDTVLFSKDGSIYIDVPIRRYVGKTSASGYLLNSGVLGAQYLTQNICVYSYGSVIGRKFSVRVKSEGPLTVSIVL